MANAERAWLEFDVEFQTTAQYRGFVVESAEAAPAAEVAG